MRASPEAKNSILRLMRTPDFSSATSTEKMQASHSAAMLSVGLAPGSTNLMVAACLKQFDVATEARIALLAGLNDNHGPAALEWTAGKIFARSRQQASALICVGRGWGTRKVHAVGFSDQFALARTVPGLQAVTYLGSESRVATVAVFALARCFAGNELVRKSASALFRPMGVGSGGRFIVRQAGSAPASRPSCQHRLVHAHDDEIDVLTGGGPGCWIGQVDQPGLNSKFGRQRLGCFQPAPSDDDRQVGGFLQLKQRIRPTVPYPPTTSTLVISASSSEATACKSPPARTEVTEPLR